MASKTILITGITGMVGSHLLDYVADNEDCTVVGLCRWRSPMENIQHHTDTINRQNRIRLEYGDLNDVHSLRRIFEKYKFDYISHLAAHSFLTSFDSHLRFTIQMSQALQTCWSLLGSSLRMPEFTYVRLPKFLAEYQRKMFQLMRKQNFIQLVLTHLLAPT